MFAFSAILCRNIVLLVSLPCSSGDASWGKPSQGANTNFDLENTRLPLRFFTMPLLVVSPYSGFLAHHGRVIARPHLDVRSSSTTSMNDLKDTELIANTDGRQLLLSFASRRTSEAAKSAILQQMMSRPLDQRDDILDEALRVIDQNQGQLFSRRQWPIPLPSRRATLGSYGRLLEGMMSEESGSGARFIEGGDSGKRRRFLSVLLRQLRASKGGIWGLEREARKRNSASTSMEEMLTRTPADLETPKYSVVNRRTSWEIRKYDEFVVAATRRNRTVEANGVKLQQPAMPAAGGFQALAGYIFGRNKGANGESEKMAMTTPVFNSASSGEMSFVLPSRYWEMNSTQPPAPLDASVKIVREGGGALQRSDTLACLWFGGFAGSGEVARRQAELLDAISKDESWEVASSEGEAQQDLFLLLQYNDPFTPPWKRRNEVALPVRRRL